VTTTTRLPTDGGTAPSDRQVRLGVLGAVLVVAALVPLLFTGPGTDLDASSVVRTGRGIVQHLSYTPSRAPGTPVYEAAVGVLDAMGGIPLADLGSLLMAVVCAAAFWKLAKDGGIAHPLPTTLVVVANPWFLIAATSIEDFVWALALMLVGVLALRSRHAWLAGVLFALAIGSRSTTVVLVAAAVLAALWEGRDARRDAAIAGGTAAVLGAALFVPAYLSADRTFRFLHNDFATASPLVQLGRFAVKDLYLFGPLAAIVMLFAVPAVFALRSRWRQEWLVRFAFLGLLFSQLLFLRFPWKMGHLLPTVVFVALLLGLALGSRPRLLYGVVVAQLVTAFVTVNLFAPNHPNRATSASPELTAAWGPVVRDTQCRIRYRHDSLSPVRSVRERAGVCASPFAVVER